MTKLKYKRVLLKISGESLLGESAYGIDDQALISCAAQLSEIRKTGIELAVVIGGGNIYRGMVRAAQSGMNRSVADQIGMLATVMNALALQEALERNGTDARVMTAFPANAISETFIRRPAIRHLEKGRVLILAAGTGHPFFTTDTAAALRAAELEAEVILKATTVDGVYDKDPKANGDAVLYDRIDYAEYLRKDLKVMDGTAVSLCRSCKLPIIVFDLTDPANIINILYGDNVGTRIGEDSPW